MKILKTEAVALFAALGVKTAAKWPVARLADKLAKASALVDEDTNLDPEMVGCLNDVLAAGAAGEVFEVQLLDAKAEKLDAKALKASEAKAKAKAEKAVAKATAPVFHTPMHDEPTTPELVEATPTIPALPPAPAPDAAAKKITKSRSYFAGLMVRKHGLTKATQEVATEVDGLYQAESGRSNPRESMYSLRLAVQSCAGFADATDAE